MVQSPEWVSLSSSRRGDLCTLPSVSLSGPSGTDVPLLDSPDRESKIYAYLPAPPLSSYLQTWTWYDPDPSIGLHLNYIDPARGISLGLTFGFSPGGIPGIGDLPNNTPNNANFPHAAGDFGSVIDWGLSTFGHYFGQHYNEQVDAGSWLGGRFYVHW